MKLPHGHVPRHCFTDFWWDATANELTVLFTEGSYYTYSGVADEGWTAITETLDGGFNGFYCILEGRPTLFGSSYEKVTGPPTTFDEHRSAIVNTGIPGPSP
jgi:hypothetical protein